MQNTELLDNLQQDLGNVSASRQAHQQILNIIQAYRKRIQQEDAQIKEADESDR